MSEEPAPTPPSNIHQDPQWGAVLSSRREVVPNVILVEQPAARSRWIAVAMMASLASLIVGGFVTGLISEPKPAAPLPTVTMNTLVQTVTATPTETQTATATATLTSTDAPTSRPAAKATISPVPTSTPTAMSTSTATPTPTITPPAPVTVIIARALNVRAGPSVEHPIVGYAAQGQQYRVAGKSDDGRWLKIDFGGLEGWVSGKWTRAMPEDGPSSSNVPLE